MGKHRIPIEKVEDKHQRHICFSKRRKGLFKKASELCKLGCEASILVISSAQNVFSFAYPDLDLVLDRFLDAGTDRQQLALVPYAAQGHQEEDVEGELEDDQMTTSSVEDEGSFEEQSKMEEDCTGGAGDGAVKVAAPTEQACWWNQPLDGMREEELREMERSIVELRGMAMERWKELFLQEAWSLAPAWAPSRSQTAEITTTGATTSSSSSAKRLPATDLNKGLAQSMNFDLELTPPADLDLELKL